MLTEQQRRELDWEKTDGLMPVIVQHAVSGEVLMLGYMNPEALDKTIESGKVTFFSRTKQRLWTKGETSGNFLNRVHHRAGLTDNRAATIDNIIDERHLEFVRPGDSIPAQSIKPFASSSSPIRNSCPSSWARSPAKEVIT